MMSTKDKNQFLYESLADLQGTIRAVDIKVSFLLVFLLLPLTKLDTIYLKIKELLFGVPTSLTIISGIAGCLFIIIWILAFWCTFRTLIAIDDPKHHIDGGRPESCFYPAFLFNYGFWNIILNRSSQTKAQFANHYNTIPDDLEEISKHLTLEQMKVMYIAYIKIKRSHYAYYLTMTWIISGGIFCFLHLIA